MLLNSPNRHFKTWTVAMAASGMFAMTANQSAWSDEPNPPRSNAIQSESPDAKSTAMMDEHAEDESPALGVVVGSCPGDAVCVLDTIWGSPADQAGLRHGDYILAVNDKNVSSPIELKHAIEASDAGKEVTLTVWRHGTETKKQVMPASMSEELPANHRAWLGVMLSPAHEGNGVLIEQVMQDSPAAEAGLRSGDRITKRGDKQVTNVQSFIESVEDMGPGSEMQLTVQRSGNDQQLSVTLGDKCEAPMRFQRALRPSMDNQDMGSSRGSGGSMEMLDETIDEMRREIRELSNEVRELKTGNQKQPMPAEKEDLSKSDPFADGTITLVVDRNDRGDSSNWNRGRSWNNNYNNDWRNRYRSGYRSPLYRSPGFGNSYYRNGGQSYYGNFGRNYGYGGGYGQGGVRIGNFGVWW